MIQCRANRRLACLRKLAGDRKSAPSASKGFYHPLISSLRPNCIGFGGKARLIELCSWRGKIEMNLPPDSFEVLTSCNMHACLRRLQLFHFGTNISDPIWRDRSNSFFMISFSFPAKKEDMDLLEISPDQVIPFTIPHFPDSDDDLVSRKAYIRRVSWKASPIQSNVVLRWNLSLYVWLNSGKTLWALLDKKLCVLVPLCFQTIVDLKPLPVDPVKVAVTTKIPLFKLRVSH